MRKFAFSIAAVLLWPIAASSVTLQDFSLKSGQDLVNLCTVEDGDPFYNEAMSFCFGFFTGTMHFNRELLREPNVSALACPEAPVSREEAVDAFLVWAKANPDRLQDQAIQVAIRSAVEKWPCK